MRTYVRMVACVHLPRFELLVAAGGSSEVGPQTLRGRPLAVAPLVAGGERTGGTGATGVGEVSQAAEAMGVRRGMALGEALARCPELVLLPADPVRVAERWEEALEALEAIGAAVEPARPGLAYFEADGLRALHGTLAATLARAQGAVAHPVRIGAAPTRFCALACALAARSRRPLVLEGEHARRWLAGRPVELLGYREQTAALPEPLARLGVRTLGELTRLGRAALSDRFGAGRGPRPPAGPRPGPPAAPPPPPGASGGVAGGGGRQQRSGVGAGVGGARPPAAGTAPAGGALAAHGRALGRSSSPGAAGASGSCSASRWRTRSGSGWHCRCGCSRSRVPPAGWA